MNTEYPNISTAGRLANLYAGHMPRFEYECQDAAEEYTYRKGEGSSYTFLDGSTVTFFEEDSSHYGFEIDHNFDIDENVAAFQAMAENINAQFAAAVLADFESRHAAEGALVRAAMLGDYFHTGGFICHEEQEPLRVVDVFEPASFLAAMTCGGNRKSFLDVLHANADTVRQIINPAPTAEELAERRTALYAELSDLVADLRAYNDGYYLVSHSLVKTPGGGLIDSRQACLACRGYQPSELRFIAEAIELLEDLEGLSDPV